MKRFASLVLALAALLAACDLPPSTQETGQETRETVQDRGPVGGEVASDLPPMTRASLPAEGRAVLAQIARGGPFRYSKDGQTFGNRERRLPRQPTGYYREYTVPTPGAGNRGARRLVCGGEPVTRTDDCYYTADHYDSFRRLAP